MRTLALTLVAATALTVAAYTTIQPHAVHCTDVIYMPATNKLNTTGKPLYACEINIQADQFKQVAKAQAINNKQIEK